MWRVGPNVSNFHAFINCAELHKLAEDETLWLARSMLNRVHNAYIFCVQERVYFLKSLFNRVWSKWDLHSIILFIYSDVGMIMMQTGMVKQGLNSTSHTYIDGMNKRIQTSIVGFICKKIKLQINYECATFVLYIYINDNQLCSATYYIAYWSNYIIFFTRNILA